jgi:predicted  nucleic acid-binding Zn-ribbon protein
MPHQCTSCGHTFADGSKEMLSGCPDCGGNKFQFRPARSDDGATTDADPGATAPDPEPDPAPGDDARSGGDDPLSRPWPGQADADDADDADDAEIIEADPRPPADGPPAADDPTTAGDGPEDGAQADARTGVVSADELADAASAPEPADGSAAGAEPPVDRPDDGPDLADLRAELNDQFESIKVLTPGRYELNLMELYDREEYIISLREDGRYVIEVPESWRRTDDA